MEGRVGERARPAAPELLAPAGGAGALRAAIRNGADAVYLGTGSLNARRGAENFSLPALAEACDFAHLRGARVYLTANVVVLASEMPAALELIARSWEAGVDAVIVQDLGLLLALHRSLPDVRVHASTQLDAHNAASVAALAGLGVQRVTLARELSVSEIATLVEASPVQIECFVHGSLCFCHSGQCLMSSMVGGRSANRGLCAQPCRLPYELVDASGSVAETSGRYLLSPRDLAGIELLPQLVESGVSSLKIEGRMKSADYVAEVVSVYRAALDRVLAAPDEFAVTAAETDRLAEAFNRGFTQGYLADVCDDRLMSYGRPNNRGVALGRVVEYRSGVATVTLDCALESEDTLEFWTASGRFAQKAGPLECEGGVGSAAPEGARVRIRTGRAVRAGDRVFRVTNAALVRAARRSWQGSAERRPVPLRMRARLRVGEPLALWAEAGGAEAEVRGAVVEAARTKAVTAPEVAEHLGRLGGTPYGEPDLTIDLDATAGISFADLHEIRRQAIALLNARRLEPWAGRSAPSRPAPPPIARTEALPRHASLVVAVEDAEAARSCVDAGADRVVCAVYGEQHLPRGVEALLPRVAHEAEMDALVSAAGAKAVCGNLGLLRELAAHGVDVEADWGLNVVNAWSAEALRGSARAPSGPHPSSPDTRSRSCARTLRFRWAWSSAGGSS